MRVSAVAGFMLLGLASAASAQQQAATLFSGVPANQIKNVPIDTSKAIGGKPGTSASLNRFDFTAIFNRNNVPTYPPKRGVSPLPAPSSFPSTKYKPHQLVNDPPYLIKWMFGNSKKSPLEPAMPYTPTTPSPVGPGS